MQTRSDTCNRTLLGFGPEAVLYAILVAVVDGYAPEVSGLDNDIDEIETEVFSGVPAVCPDVSMNRPAKSSSSNAPPAP